MRPDVHHRDASRRAVPAASSSSSSSGSVEGTRFPAHASQRVLLVHGLTRSRRGQEGPHPQAQVVKQADRIPKHRGAAHQLVQLGQQRARVVALQAGQGGGSMGQGRCGTLAAASAGRTRHVLQPARMRGSRRFAVPAALQRCQTNQYCTVRLSSSALPTCSSCASAEVPISGFRSSSAARRSRASSMSARLSMRCSAWSLGWAVGWVRVQGVQGLSAWPEHASNAKRCDAGGAGSMQRPYVGTAVLRRMQQGGGALQCRPGPGMWARREAVRRQRAGCVCATAPHFDWMARGMARTWVALKRRGHERDGQLQGGNAQHINVHLLLSGRQPSAAQAAAAEQRSNLWRQPRQTERRRRSRHCAAAAAQDACRGRRRTACCSRMQRGLRPRKAAAVGVASGAAREGSCWRARRGAVGAPGSQGCGSRGRGRLCRCKAGAQVPQELGQLQGVPLFHKHGHRGQLQVGLLHTQHARRPPLPQLQPCDHRRPPLQLHRCCHSAGEAADGCWDHEGHR